MIKVEVCLFTEFTIFKGSVYIMKMNLYEFVSAIRIRPGIYFRKKKINSLYDLGFFMEGFFCAEVSTELIDDFDNYFNSEFPEFVKKEFNDETPPFEFWFETIANHSNSGDEAIDMFFKLFDEFYSIYESKTE